MSGEFDERKHSQSTKFGRRPGIFVKLSFRESCDSKLSGLHAFTNMAIIHWVKVVEETFVTPTENSSVAKNDTQGPQKYPHHWK